MLKRDLGYYLSLLPAVICIFGNTVGGWWTAGNLFFSIGVLGGLEFFTGRNLKNQHSPSRAILPEFLLFMHAIAHTGVLITLFKGVFSGQLHGIFLIFAIISSGIEAGSGAIIIAHELIHKASPVKRAIGQYLLLSAGNFYFYTHHLRVHHRFVGTESDSATAKRGESLYGFFVRTVIGQSAEAWTSETNRLQKLGIGVLALKNKVLLNILILVFVAMALLIILGPLAILTWLGLIVVANFLLEYVNYIEHYGLVRQPEERVNETHSWNCDKVISRFMLIDLSRHADHHFYASKPYHTLQTYQNSPTMPGGYISMIFPALVPGWWFSIMHPRLDSLKTVR